MKTFVINLESRKDRLDKLAAQLDEHGFEWERFPALNGYKLTYGQVRDMGYDICKEWVDPLLNRRMTMTEIACAISHMKLWEKCVELNESILILEDDVVYIPDSNFSLEHANGLLRSFDMVYLDHREMMEHKKVILSDLSIPHYPYLCSSYIISPGGALKLLESRFKELLIPVDEFIPMMLGVDHTKSTLATTPEVKYTMVQAQSHYLGIGFFKAIAYEDNKPFVQVSRQVLGSDIESGRVLNSSLHALTVATDENMSYMLKESAGKFNINVSNLGRGVKWVDGDMTGMGGGQKLKLVKRYLEEVEDESLVLFLDGYDVFINDDLNTIVNRFRSFNCDVLFAAEKTCWPDKNISHNFPESTTPYRYLNSGLYIGYAWAIKELLVGDPGVDDQFYLQNKFIEQYHFKKKINIKLDYESYVFQCVAGAEEDIEVIVNQKYKQLYNNKTNVCPCILHGNGGEVQKTFLKNTYRSLFVKQLEFDTTVPLEKLGDEILGFSFLTKPDCDYLIKRAEETGVWKTMPGDKFPGQEARIKDIDPSLFMEISDKFMKWVVPQAENYWFPLSVYGIRDMFIIKYSTDTQDSLPCHHDASLISGSIKLNEDYEGGELVFNRQRFSNMGMQAGEVIVWPGQVTHGHESLKLTSGTKYSLTIWTSRYKGDIN